ncbi:hypothetical protein AVEN_121655-1 [Araneus ventricosus]|uniref:ATP-dependent DNA helicase n=1 Tax=Araneus ventricosus TaxID=182803 RepID=A0A4Y2X0S1_ARAVE|nr:hypothetical protein AVEN_121655-1 [Araneus ventricosus]
MQPVYFYDDEERQTMERAARRNTMLTAWFRLNGTDLDANRYFYADIPKHFDWKNYTWERRVRLGYRIVSRLYSVSPKDTERFHLRMLLFHVPGVNSFEELRTYDSVTMDSFKEACRAKNLLEDDVRGLGEIVVPIAWTGITAIILEGGRTSHSRFKLPVPILDNSSCSIGHNTEDGGFLKAVKLIIWDECTMTPHHALSVVGRLLRDLMNYYLPFGSKGFVLSDDWRQILSVVVHANRTTIIETFLKNSPLWSTFKQFSLVRNMRTEHDEQDFVDWFLHLDNRSLTNNCQLGEDVVKIPEECAVRDSIVDEIFCIVCY